MKRKLVLAAIITTAIFLSSCSKEDETVMQKNGITTEHQDSQDKHKRTASSQRQLSSPYLGIPSPCGYGFNLGLNPPNTGTPIQFPYEVWLNGQIQFSGTLVEGQNTDWNLNPLTPCTNYVFKFWGYGFQVGSPTNVVTVTSDGCGGNFVC
ncbi:MAG: hypothetical protein JKY48_06500 [Flavobacteriales bacterium]|nr:hypothetical protein [Flavobacteriales bacterium]